MSKFQNSPIIYALQQKSQKKDKNVWVHYYREHGIFIQTCKECRSPVNNASSDTLKAKIGPLSIPQSTLEFPLELWF